MSNVENSDAVGAVSAGTLLRQAREASGLHIAALAVIMKIPVKKLEALESDRLDLLPDAVFARALAASMCRALKIDPTAVLDKLPGSKKVSLKMETRVDNEPFNKSTYSASLTSSTKLGKTAIFTVVALLLGVVLILFVPSTDDVKTTVDATEEEVEPHFPLEAAKPPVEEIVVQDLAPIPASSAPVIAPLLPSAPLLPVEPVPKASAPVPTSVLKQDAVTAPSPVSVNHVVFFKVRGPSWVEVTDAKGVIQLRRNLNEGDEASATGALPMVVVVGRVDVTDVSVRGKPFDMSKLAVSNVARFEVK